MRAFTVTTAPLLLRGVALSPFSPGCRTPEFTEARLTSLAAVDKFIPISTVFRNILH
jgi:hypothetical protein